MPPRRSAFAFAASIAVATALSPPLAGATAATPLRLPWREAGWSEREAAAHLLDRLAYGARPGEVERVVALGLERWVERQLAANLPDPALDARLARLPALALSPEAIVATYPPGFAVRRMAAEAGVISREEIAAAEAAGEPRAGTRRKVYDWMTSQGMRPEAEQLAQAMARKLWGALEGENQLAERLADFWFNHFHVAIADPPVRSFVLAYERDAIRPHVLGSFRALLGATAKHPAMLTYLDNYNSVASPGQPTTLAARAASARGLGAGSRRRGLEAARPARPNRPQGLNENYARELLELHTLGVDGGYTQQDVVEVARAFTGWSVFPRGRMPGAEEAMRRYERVRRAGGLGFERDGLFVFRADAHDAAAKVVLGTKLPAGRGIEDGEAVLDLLAAHPSTARHLATKLAAKFVADRPPAALVDRLAATFRASGGDLRATMAALVAAPEFWARAARAAKVKSPFETAVSALRAIGASVGNPIRVLDWIARMGEPLYAYAAPTGYPDRAEFWVNAGALLARMNFGLELAAGRIPGVAFELEALLAHREPESAAAALAALGAVVLPERDLAEARRRLVPLLADAEVPQRLAARAPESAGLELGEEPPGETADEGRGRAARPDRRAARSRPPDADARARRFERLLAGLFPPAPAPARPGETPSTPATALGLLLGSPEFQRR